MSTRRQPTEPAVMAAIEAGCRTLRLPTIRTRFGEIAAAAQREQLTYLPRRAGDGRMRRPHHPPGGAAPTPRGLRLHRQPRHQSGHHPPARRLRLDSATAAPLFDRGLRHGKSHLLIALGTAAAEHGYRVKYTLASKLVNELAEAADDRQLTRIIARYGRVDLLILDELGYLSLDRRGAELLFEVLTEREERASIAVGKQ